PSGASSPGRSAPTTESVSTIETESAIRRQSRARRLQTLVGAAAVAGAGLGIWVLGRASTHREHEARTPLPAPPAAAARTPPPAPRAPPAARGSRGPGAPASTEPTVRPEALPDAVSVRLTTHPADVEVWQGDRRLVASAGAIALPRGASPIDLRLKKTGFGDT